MHEETEVKRETLGVRNIMNTNHPIERVCKRVVEVYGERRKAPYWKVYTVCNGIVESSRRYDRKSAALENF